MVYIENQDSELNANVEANIVDDPGDRVYSADDQNFSLSKKVRSKNHICHVCNATFARVNHLTRHMILHRNVLVHQCERCDKVSIHFHFFRVSNK